MPRRNCRAALTAFNPPFLSNQGGSLLLDGSIPYEGGSPAIRDADGVVREGLIAFDLSIPVGVGPEPPITALSLELAPNPAREGAHIHLRLPRGGHVRVGVFDLHGREVMRLVDARIPAGSHDVVWNGRTSSGRRESGVYFVRAETDAGVTTKRLVVFR